MGWPFGRGKQRRPRALAVLRTAAVISTQFTLPWALLRLGRRRR
jgi:hypothetical protein